MKCSPLSSSTNSVEPTVKKLPLHLTDWFDSNSGELALRRCTAGHTYPALVGTERNQYAPRTDSVGLHSDKTALCFRRFFKGLNRCGKLLLRNWTRMLKFRFEMIAHRFMYRKSTALSPHPPLATTVKLPYSY